MTRLSRRFVLPVARAYERVVGGRIRKRLLTAALRRNYRS
jgi:hypothetical protein